MALDFTLTTRHLYNTIMFDKIRSYNKGKYCCLQYEMIEISFRNWYIRSVLNL